MGMLFQSEGRTRSLSSHPKGFCPPTPAETSATRVTVTEAAPQPPGRKHTGKGRHGCSKHILTGWGGPYGAPIPFASPGVPLSFLAQFGGSFPPNPPSQSAGRQPPSPTPCFPRSICQWSPPQPPGHPGGPQGRDVDPKIWGVEGLCHPNTNHPQGLPSPWAPPCSSRAPHARVAPETRRRNILRLSAFATCCFSAAGCCGCSGRCGAGMLSPWASGSGHQAGPGEPEPTVGKGQQAANSHFLPPICPR